MTNIKLELEDFTAAKARNNLKEKYKLLFTQLALGKGVYIWGTGKLGRYAMEQCSKNRFKVLGYIDNDEEKWNVAEKVFSWDVLKSDDIIIIASFYYPQIMEQVKSLGIENCIYYEELACLIEGMETYYTAFENIFEELEKNKREYEKVYNLFTDNLSKEIYTNIVLYKASLDTKYTTKALSLSEQEGIEDFDKVVIEKLDGEYSFFDAGGFDGGSTLDFIHFAGEYEKIYFFEPDKKIFEESKKKLENFSNIIYICAGVGEKSGYKNYNAIGGGAGFISEDETDESEQIRMVALDDLVKSHKSYIKMDIEGYELAALRGAEQAIKLYKPMLSISVYHQPSDLHDIIPLVLSWNPDYKVFLRHYLSNYSDTRVYFISNE